MKYLLYIVLLELDLTALCNCNSECRFFFHYKCSEHHSITLQILF